MDISVNSVSSKSVVNSRMVATNKIFAEVEKLTDQLRHDEAYELLLPLAQQGNAEAQLTIALMIGEGQIFQKTTDQGIVPDYHQARIWFEMAANSEVTRAEKTLFGLGDWEGIKSTDQRKGNDFIAAIAKYELGMLYLYGNGVTKNVGTACALFDAASQLGSPKADFELGKMMALGHDVSRNFEKAVQLLESARANGVNEATCVLGKLFALGHGTKLPPAQAQQLAFSYFVEAYKQGSLEAGCELGKMHMLGCGCQQSLAYALFYFLETYHQVNEAKFELAKLVLYGYASYGHQPTGTRNFVPYCEDRYFNRATMYSARSARLNCADDDFDRDNLKRATTNFDSVNTPTSQLYLLVTKSVFNEVNKKNSLKELYEKHPELCNTFSEVHNRLEATSVFTNEVKGLDAALCAMDTYPEAIDYYQSVTNNEALRPINHRARYQNDYGVDYSADHHYFQTVFDDPSIHDLTRGDAAYQLALLSIHGRGVEKNVMAGTTYLERAIQFGNPNAKVLHEKLKKQPDMLTELYFMASNLLSNDTKKESLQDKWNSDL